VSLRVLFVHGLESNPHGSKARFLAAHFECVTPAMDTADFAGCVETIAAALRARQPDVVVGSSFGGAVVVALLQRGDWSGPTLLLAPATTAFGVEARLPAGVPVCIVHGTADRVVEPEDSRRLARTGSSGLVELVEVADEHRLSSLVDSGRLTALIHAVAARAHIATYGRSNV
jgi:alpha-beta hydrolase superfamily lysophospholipase